MKKKKELLHLKFPNGWRKHYVFVFRSIACTIHEIFWNKHETRDRGWFIDYRRILSDKQNLFRENSIGKDVMKLLLWTQKIFWSSMICFMCGVQHNLVSTVALLGFGFIFNFSGNKWTVIWVLNLLDMLIHVIMDDSISCLTYLIVEENIESF